ncbi:hypothetical protein Ciccas_014583 [Cichlidogyrus casuarinus]|uniref:Uncharacterized protein n=1 Tax=Cichlidogyrus casuarinus TaxID=1844966 RepID=A0ABD2PIJ8_9PLAT
MGLWVEIFAGSSLLPLSKIANASSRSVRVLWGIFTGTMLSGLVISVVFVTLQYTRHQTAFQLDYSSDYDDPPGMTICYEFLQDKQSKVEKKIKQFHKNSQWKPEPILYMSDEQKLSWSTLTARSPIYRQIHNFSIKFSMTPSELDNNLRLFVSEEVSCLTQLNIHGGAVCPLGNCPAE